MSIRTTAPHAQAVLRANGYSFDTVERWIPFSKRRKDFCGFADILAFHPEKIGVLAVQTCAFSRINDHIANIFPGQVGRQLKHWLVAGNRFEIWGWSKRSRKGQGKPPRMEPRFVKVKVRRTPKGYLLEAYDHDTEMTLFPGSEDLD